MRALSNSRMMLGGGEGRGGDGGGRAECNIRMLKDAGGETNAILESYLKDDKSICIYMQ